MGLQTQATHPAKHFPTLKTIVQLLQELPDHFCSTALVSSVELSSSTLSSGEIYGWISLIFDGKLVELIEIILDAVKGAGWESWTTLYN